MFEASLAVEDVGVQDLFDIEDARRNLNDDMAV
jgi:hypothetical protein